MILSNGLTLCLMASLFLGLGYMGVPVSFALIAGVLIQSKGEELGGVFGGASGVYQTRRGVDKMLFTITVLLAIAFFGLALVNVIVSQSPAQ